MNKTVRYILYGFASAICVIAIFVGVYAQFFKKIVDTDNQANVVIGNTAIENATMNDVKDAFKDLFANNYWGADYDDSQIPKIDGSQKIVYSAITNYSKEEEGKYKISATLPAININNDVANTYNTNTTNVFINKINEIVNSATKYTVYDIKYTAYINDDILSVAIMATLKEGENPQRTMIQTYNYNLSTGKNVVISDIIKKRALDTSAVNKRINSLINKAADDAKAMQSTGYNVYERDTTSNYYDINNVDNFMQGPNGELYIIYAYGNKANTSEMDVINI